ncbi:hypothetical protein GOBAR_AA16616 [Gossypium barbadense]|uniref:Uncharacterized protein n=1 Tax=Gossypium barbadense TaxID=3634 RepID=A0A2P5XL37_GOSBA|nr:hypothetical protein GOBAR_AA16616 [Gossypium barbadense]
MADIAKYTPINGGTTTAVTAEFKNLFSIIKTRRTVAFFMFAFVGFTVFLVFSPSSNSSSPWVTNIFSSTSSPATSSAADNPSEDLLSAKKTNKTQSFNINKQRPSSENTTFRSPYSGLNNTKSSVLHANQTTVSPPPNLNQNPPSTNNQTGKKENSDKAQVLKSNQTTTVTEKTLEAANRSTNSPAKSESSNKLSSGKGEKIVGQKGVVSNYSASLTNKPSNGSDSGMIHIHFINLGPVRSLMSSLVALPMEGLIEIIRN